MRYFSVASLTCILIAAFTPFVCAAESVPFYNWTGFYGGLNAGWNWGKANATTLIIAPAQSSFIDSTSANGAIGGIQFGYNWKSTPNWIVGIEADLQASGTNAISSSHRARLNTGFGAVVSESFSHTDSLNWFGTVRGRAGYAVWQDLMLYRDGWLGVWARQRINASIIHTAYYCSTLYTSNDQYHFRRISN
jgi:opacity protein-like surface antigen